MNADERTIEQKLREARDGLFRCAEAAIKCDLPDWQRGKALFKLAEDADILRQKLVALDREMEKPTPTLTTPEDSGKPAPSMVTARVVRVKLRSEEFPKYVVRGDALVRIGLSRNGRDQYEHVVPKECFDQVVSKLAEIAATERRQFAINDIQAGLKFPSYQTYSVVALFRDRELLKVPRRGVYAFAERRNFRDAATGLWQDLIQNAD